MDAPLARSLLLWVVAGLLGGSAWVEAMPLSQALETLRTEGIHTIYTSRLVKGDFHVERLPDPGSAEQRLNALLSPFGLIAKPMGDGSWRVVVSRSGTVDGCLVSDPGGQAVAGATVRLDETRSPEPSDPAGCYRLLGVAAGEHVITVSKPGYVSARRTVHMTPGAAQRVDFSLVIDALAEDEIFVTTTLEQPPLGTVSLGPSRLERARRSDGDLLAAARRLPGTLEGVGVSFGVRGRLAERLTLVVDGMDIVEPYHFRHLGSLAGTVTPGAVAEAQLHRGSPPLIYGNRAGGVLEMVTATAVEPFAGGLGSTGETHQAGLRGSWLDGRGRWLTAYRRGRPTIPGEIAELDSLPRYSDALAKASMALGPRQELGIQALWARDDFSFRPSYLLAADDPDPVLFAHQRSRHGGLRHRLSLGDRHLVDTLLSDVRADRRRFGYEHEYSGLKPDNPRAYRLEDFRISQRRQGRVEVKSRATDRLDLLWGFEAGHERTDYDYAGFELGPFERVTPRLTERRRSGFGQATWHARDDLTLKVGLRTDHGPWGEHQAPRASLSLRRGKAVWRLGVARAVSVSATHELRLADGEAKLPEPETTDYLSLGWSLSHGGRGLSLEAYSQRIPDPRSRFINLYKPVSRIPELEIDRLRLAPQESLLQGIEARLELRREAWQGGVAYQLARAQDRLDGHWQPRATDRRHTLNAWLSWRSSDNLWIHAQWSGATGRPTTPFDPVRFAEHGFDAAVGLYQGDRLPPEHQLDLRMGRQWRFEGLSLSAEWGVDNLYDRRAVRGFDLSSLQDGVPLPAELGLGRRARWGVELAW